MPVKPELANNPKPVKRETEEEREKVPLTFPEVVVIDPYQIVDDGEAKPAAARIFFRNLL